MKPKRLLIGSMACLAVGLGVIFGFGQGTTNLSLGNSLSAASLHIDITTTGMPAAGGLALGGIALLLLLFALISAIAGVSRSKETPARREEPFQE